MVSRWSILALLCIVGTEASNFIGRSATQIKVPPDYKEHSAQVSTEERRAPTSPALQHADVYDEDFPKDSSKKTAAEKKMERESKGQVQQPAKSKGVHPQAFVAMICMSLVAVSF
eukprot:gnl/MRDRNA2_/MRDRNA2_109536_c0_seq1.p1 gnl/MRDRNA2_/MRDRNA2_109536_c0~~gnl/MRDRNA2_/MRDRNA2_109536_c0_seq1.p1  ORF type:complete len:115 (+),score=19.26 gnl/MRDRNA2_/MRDRNA2_109536_c0_seq1:109-453(+)